MLNALSSVQCDGVCVNVGADTHARQGMDHLHLPTVDFFCAPKVEAMFRGVDYISKHVAAGAAPRPSPNLFICSQFSVVVYPLKAPPPALNRRPRRQEGLYPLQGGARPQRQPRVLLPHSVRRARTRRRRPVTLCPSCTGVCDCT